MARNWMYVTQQETPYSSIQRCPRCMRPGAMVTGKGICVRCYAIHSLIKAHASIANNFAREDTLRRANKRGLAAQRRA
jgi:hypothetical protein